MQLHTTYSFCRTYDIDIRKDATRRGKKHIRLIKKFVTLKKAYREYRQQFGFMTKQDFWFVKTELGTKFSKKFRHNTLGRLLLMRQCFRYFYGSLKYQTLKKYSNYARQWRSKSFQRHSFRKTFIFFFEFRLNTILFRSKLLPTIISATNYLKSTGIIYNKQQIHNSKVLITMGNYIQFNFTYSHLLDLIHTKCRWPFFAYNKYKELLLYDYKYSKKSEQIKQKRYFLLENIPPFLYCNYRIGLLMPIKYPTLKDLHFPFNKTLKLNRVHLMTNFFILPYAI